MIKARSADNIDATFNRLKEHLPDLFEDMDADISNKLRSLIVNLQQSNVSTERDKLVRELLNEIEVFPKLDERIKYEVQLQRILTERVLDQLQNRLLFTSDTYHIALAVVRVLRWEYDGNKVDNVDISSGDRLVTISKEGKDTTSFKLKNLQVDLDEFATIAAGALIAAKDITKEPDPVTICIGILLVLAAFTGAMKKEYSEIEGTVFFALTQVQDKYKRAAISDIHTKVNEIRQKRSAPSLTVEEVKNSLYSLQDNASVKVYNEALDIWELTEHFRIKG